MPEGASLLNGAGEGSRPNPAAEGGRRRRQRGPNGPGFESSADQAPGGRWNEKGPLPRPFPGGEAGYFGLLPPFPLFPLFWKVGADPVVFGGRAADSLGGFWP